MNIGVISDIHSNSLALEQVLETLQNHNVERILCSGDIVGYGSKPNEVINQLRTADVECVLGNHDEGILEGTPSEFNINAKRALDWNRRNLVDRNLAYLSELETEKRETIDGSDLYMVHGSPRNPLSGYVRPEDLDTGFLEFSFQDPPDILIIGQTHKPFVSTAGNTLVVNPGSVGQPRDGDPRASCAIINLDKKTTEILRVDYDNEEMSEDVIKYLPKSLAERLLVGK